MVFFPKIVILVLLQRDALKQSFSAVTDSAVNKINSTLGDSITALTSKQQMFNTGSTNIDPINAKLDEILRQQQQEPDLNITRDEQGRVASIGGRPVQRDPNGRLRGVD